MDDNSDFLPEDYSFTAELLRWHMNRDRALFQAVCSNNLSIILAALDAAVATRDLRTRYFELEHLYADTLASREMEQRDAAANDALPPKRCPQPDYCVAQRICHWNCDAEHGS